MILSKLSAKVRGLFRKRKGAGFLQELGVYILVASALLAIGIFSSQFLMNAVNNYRVDREMQEIATACQAYQSASVASAPPTDLGKLVTGLSAAESTTGKEEKPFVSKKTWTSAASSFVDPWGNPYQYDAAARTLTSTNNGNTAKVVSF